MDSAFIFQIAAVFFGGGSVQLFVFHQKRRAELRSLDTASDATLLNSANAYIVTLQAGDKALREEVTTLKTEISVLKQAYTEERLVLRKEWDTERTSNTEALETANREVSRFRLDLAKVRSDLAVAQDQITDLSSRLGKH